MYMFIYPQTQKLLSKLPIKDFYKYKNAYINIYIHSHIQINMHSCICPILNICKCIYTYITHTYCQ
jgi:hypothetical protein